jgi:hypothetical protein
METQTAPLAGSERHGIYQKLSVATLDAIEHVSNFVNSYLAPIMRNLKFSEKLQDDCTRL